jgi:hypothetical protein
MDSKINDIELLKVENPIFAFIKDDNEKILYKKRRKGIPHYDFDVLVESPKQFFTLCCQLVKDPIKCIDTYETLDISDLYTFYTYNLAINYEPYVEEKQ